MVLLWVLPSLHQIVLLMWLMMAGALPGPGREVTKENLRDGSLLKGDKKTMQTDGGLTPKGKGSRLLQLALYKPGFVVNASKRAESRQLSLFNGRGDSRWLDAEAFMMSHELVLILYRKMIKKFCRPNLLKRSQLSQQVPMKQAEFPEVEVEHAPNVNGRDHGNLKMRTRFCNKPWLRWLSKTRAY